VKFDDVVPATDATSSRRAQWGRAIASALYNAHQFFSNFKEEFALRNRLLRVHGGLQQAGLATSRSMDALQGKDGWLFYTGDDAIAQFRRVQPLDEKQLAAWQAFLETERAWLARQGIDFLVVVAPEKHTVYPEFMPAYLQPARAPSRADQLMAQLSPSSLNVLDLRPALLASKERWPQHAVFYRTDTHWNALGAYAAYEATARRLGEKYSGLQAAPLADFELSFRPGRGGDLARLLGRQTDMSEEHIEFKPLGTRAFPAQESIFFRDGAGQFQEKIVAQTTGAPLQRAVFFADSFVCDTSYLSFLSQHFNSLTVFRNVDVPHIDRQAVQELQPQLVVLEFAEREFVDFSPPQE
jgi:hypothetical protein